MAQIMILENESLNISSNSEITLCLYNLFNNYSLVAYDAKVHVHAFNSGIPSLKNKKVLTITGYSTKHGSQSCDENPGKFYFSLFDWDKSIKFQRQSLKENETIPTNNEVTQTTLEDFFELNPYQRKAYNEALKEYLNE